MAEEKSRVEIKVIKAQIKRFSLEDITNIVKGNILDFEHGMGRELIVAVTNDKITTIRAYSLYKRMGTSVGDHIIIHKYPLNRNNLEIGTCGFRDRLTRGPEENYSRLSRPGLQEVNKKLFHKLNGLLRDAGMSYFKIEDSE